MKKILSLAFALAMILSLSLTAYADVIWEPFDDDFYQENREAFRLHEESYYANSPTGAVKCYDRPGGRVTDSVENGTVVNIYYIYEKDGQSWGMTMDETYMEMSLLLNRYDREFFDDHPEITDTLPAGVEGKIPMEATMYLWTYPGGVATEASNRWEEDVASGCTSFYTDADGNTWGYVGYWFGRMNCWVCLTDWDNPELAKPEIFRGTVYFGENGEPTAPVEEESQDSGIEPLYIILPAAAIVMALLLLFFWPKKKD